MDWTNTFQTPPGEYRPIPFLAINDRLEEQELRRQIREFARTGHGGYFFHARFGLATPYLSEQWMALVRACVDEGKKCGIDTWLYDENGWPSGFCDGQIPALGAAYQRKWIARAFPAHMERTERTIGFYALDERAARVTWLADERAALPDGARLLALSWESDPYYVDVLDCDVMRAFIAHTHERYKSELGGLFGQGLKGVFTDKPQYSGPTVPWSLKLPAAFAAEHGYDLLPQLPLLFYEAEGFERLRFDFYRTVSRLFTEAFSGQIGRWCEENGLVFTGHINCEEELRERVRNDAGAMTFYRHMQMPGVDWLARKIGTPVTAKQVSSAAHQCGRERVICETYGGSGWNISFEEMKWISEWLYVLGVNATCQHLALYSMRGQRKNDYPPCLNVQQPWWGAYSVFNDHFTRLSYLLTRGRHMADVLVLMPLSSAYIRYQYDRHDRGTGALDEQFEALSRWLLEEHIDFDYGDETLLHELGSVQNDVLSVGAARYRAVLVPFCEVLAGDTLALLARFARAGGKVFFTGAFPRLIGESPAPDALDTLRAHGEELALSREGIAGALRGASPEALSIAGPSGREAAQVYYQRRRLGPEEDVLFAVNISQTDTVRARVELPGAWRAWECGLDDGALRPVSGGTCGARTAFTADFAPMQSHAWRLKRGAAGPAGAPVRAASRARSLPALWHLTLDEENALVMDYARVSIDGGEMSDRMPVFQISKKLISAGRPVRAQLSFSFDFRLEPDACGPLWLALESPQQYGIVLNGAHITAAPEGYYHDVCIQKIPVTEHVRRGMNELTLTLDFACADETYALLNGGEIPDTLFNKLTVEMELCHPILLGAFGVYSAGAYTAGERSAVFTNGPFYAAPLPVRVTAGDLTQQGLCFYAGNAALSAQVATSGHARILLAARRRPRAVLYEVSVNGETCGPAAWAPFEMDLTAHLRQGENTLSVTLYGSLRNLYGPHHHITGERYDVGPSSFTDKPGWAERFLTEENIWTDRYCFAEFGMGNEFYLLEESLR